MIELCAVIRERHWIPRTRLWIIHFTC